MDYLTTLGDIMIAFRVSDGMARENDSQAQELRLQRCGQALRSASLDEVMPASGRNTGWLLESISFALQHVYVNRLTFVEAD